MKRLSAGVALWGAVLSAAGCSFEPTAFNFDSNAADPYLGYVDGLGLDSKFVPQPRGGSCPNGPCYPIQQAFAAGQPAYFYNLGAVATSSSALLDSNHNFVVPTSLVTTNVYDFSAASCAPPSSPYTFNPLTEAFPSNQQFPVFDSLPLTSYVFGSVVVPMVARWAATEPGSTTCQYLKNSTSVTSGKAGAGKGAPVDFRMWPVIDVITTGTLSATSGIASSTSVNGASCPVTYATNQITYPCPVQELPPGANGGTLQTTCTNTFNTCSSACQSGDNVCQTVCQWNYVSCTSLQQQGWSADLQLTFLEGGIVPLSVPGASTFAVMDGVIVHPYGSGNLSATTEGQVIILPFLPGQPGYSPLVLLHDFHVPQGVDLDSFGNFYNTVYTSICTTSPCQPNEVDMTQTVSSNNLLFIVAPSVQ
jgi:hypothetical protein